MNGERRRRDRGRDSEGGESESEEEEEEERRTNTAEVRTGLKELLSTPSLKHQETPTMLSSRAAVCS